MKLTATTTALGLLAITASATLVGSVQDVIDSVKVVPPAQFKFIPDSTATHFPCCPPPGCTGGCSQESGNAVRWRFGGALALDGNTFGCGEGFTEVQCLQFLQITLNTLDPALGVAATKANSTANGGDTGGTFGCGGGSNAGECLTYLRSLFKEIRAPLMTSLGSGNLLAPESDAAAIGDASASGKSEL